MKSMAVAYAMNKKKMAKGGAMHGSGCSCPVCLADGGQATAPTTPNLPGADSAQSSMRKAFKFADGGEAGIHTSDYAKSDIKNKYEKHNAGESKAGEFARKYNESTSFQKGLSREEAIDSHHKVLGEMAAMKKPNLKGLAQGGEVDGMDYDNQWVDGSEEMSKEDMISRIMKKMQEKNELKHEINAYSEGGKVSNQDEIKAGFSPNEFDVLHLEDDLKGHDTAANSGDELGNDARDLRRKDLVERIMASRAKKDKLPSPR